MTITLVRARKHKHLRGLVLVLGLDATFITFGDYGWSLTTESGQRGFPNSRGGRHHKAGLRAFVQMPRSRTSRKVRRRQALATHRPDRLFPKSKTWQHS